MNLKKISPQGSSAPVEVKKIFMQTRLFFAPLPTQTTKEKRKIKPVLDRNPKRQHTIQMIRKQNVHPVPCSVDECDASIPRFQCSSIDPATGAKCPLSFCEDCLQRLYNETREKIEANNTLHVTSKGETIHHCQDTNLEWACPVCREICVCNFCRQHTPSTPSALSVSMSKISLVPGPSTTRLLSDQKTKLIDPPILTPIKLLYSEEEVWVRLQIREFIYRFDTLCALEKRNFVTLQNVQSDWRVKSFAAALVWQCLGIISTSHYEAGVYISKQIPIHIQLEHLAGDFYAPHLAERIVQQWLWQESLDDPDISLEDRKSAFKIVLQRQGMSMEQWQDIGELLASVGFRTLPVPTLYNSDATTEKEWEKEITTIRQFRRLKRHNSPMTPLNELEMVQKLLEMLLLDTRVREQFNDSKDMKEKDQQLKNERTEYLKEYTRNKIKKSALVSRISQLRSTGKDAPRLLSESELECLEVTMQDERATMEIKELVFMIAKQKTEKRLQPAGTDNNGNTYWFFNDMLKPSTECTGHTTYGNSETWWAYGVVILGPGFNGGTERTWWCLEGISNMLRLEKYLLHEKARTYSKSEYALNVSYLTRQIERRIQYLRCMEWAVFGEGYFS
ncbi:hypothetical protein BDF14DRAFT_1958413 [Spinellus fusiger]|nr:hypothetical protein BDF14DRAFT_1958413 [Spinellus fusiger]